ncbi:MAG: alpha/beta hydrolase [Microbacteriaceae bacterium]
MRQSHTTTRVSKLILSSLSVLLVSTLSACAMAPTSANTSDTGASDPALEGFYSQSVDWRECGEGLSCSTISAPVDWSDPQGETISLSMIRHAATSGKSKGAVFVNPGGPGQSGVDLVRNDFSNAVDADLAESLDVIGFDPRGVGESNPVRCTGDASDLDAFLYDIVPGVRGSESWLDAKKEIAQRFVDGCQKYTGALLGHLDTRSVAKDLDLMRALVGESHLNYLGYSYGTFIGEVYAQEFPQNVGHLVLDGAVDAAASGPEGGDQAAGFEMALGNWISWCLERTDCPLDGTPETASAQISDMLSSLDANPLSASDGRLVGGDTFASGITSALYSPDTWPDLLEMIAAYGTGDVDPAIGLADWYNGRNDDGTYVSNDTESFIAIGCADSPPSDESTWAETAALMSEAAPVLGPYFAYGDVLCSLWPFPPVFATAGMKPTGPAPIVIIGTTGDPSTPIEWAQDVVTHLTDGRLITFTGEGHTGYDKGNACVNSLVDNFFINDVAPPRNSTC